MKAAIGSLILLTAMGACFLPFSSNVLVNPSFETGDPAPWFNPTPGDVGGTVGAPGVGAQSGSFALELVTEGTGVPEARQTFPASPGETYEFRGWMLAENALPAGPTFGLLKIVFRDDCGSDLFVDTVITGGQNPEFPGVESTPFINDASPANTWIETVASGVAPAGTVEVIFLLLNVDFNAGPNPIWYDNISAVETAAPGTNLLANADFETGDVSDWTGPAGQPPLVGAPGAGAQDGSFAIRLKGNCGAIDQSFPIAPGEEVSMSGFMLTEAALPGGSFALYKIVFRDSDGNDLEPGSVTDGQAGPGDAPGIESLPFLDVGSAPNSWIESSAAGTAPADAVEVVFLAINCDGGGGTNPVWFDNVTACTPDPCAGAIVGDLNGDGEVNLLDVSGFVDAVSNQTYSCEGDINGDGAVNLVDVDPFVGLLGGG